MPISPLQTNPDFEFKAVESPQSGQIPPEPPDELGPLAQLSGRVKEANGRAKASMPIWRPHPLAEAGQDRFLELNLTSETLVFTRVPGKIPNRGLLMPDINMFGLTYMQEIKGLDPVEGLHIEPGIWANVPPTTHPAVPTSVVRMATIPHGTTILAQDEGKTVAGGPQIAPNRRSLPTTSPPSRSAHLPHPSLTLLKSRAYSRSST